jgi:hypothetical protein
MKLILTLLLWFGLIGAAREWRYAKRMGAPHTRKEILYLAGALLLALVGSIVSDTLGLFDGLADLFQTRTSGVFWIVVVLITWTVRQMARRVRSSQPGKPMTTGT